MLRRKFKERMEIMRGCRIDQLYRLEDGIEIHMMLERTSLKIKKKSWCNNGNLQSIFTGPQNQIALGKCIHFETRHSEHELHFKQEDQTNLCTKLRSRENFWSLSSLSFVVIYVFYFSSTSPLDLPSPFSSLSPYPHAFLRH